MTLRLYNTLTRKKEEFKPISDNEVKLYSCGPTVYNYAHIGNLRAYIFSDILKRTLEYNNYKVTHVINITDVGHLTDDADDGEDKMEKGAKREGKTVWEIAKFYEDAFKDDIKKLNIKDATKWPRATQHIQEMIDINKKLQEKGYTYKAGDNLYYDTSKFKHYTELGKLNLEELEKGSRTGKDENKKNHSDFVLWFGLGGSKYGKSHSMKWDSPWGVGYPGWHIECCAMSSKYLGEHFDIHTGGIDHIPVHHTNEIAQAEAAFDTHPWVNYWLHNNFLVIKKGEKDGKMAKSGDNFLRLKLLEDKGYDPIIYRYFSLGAHYRSELAFSWEALDNAKKGYEKFKNKIIELKKDLSEDGKDDASIHIKKFEKGINDDLNTAIALASAWDVLNDNELSKKTKYNTLIKFDFVLGLNIEEMKEEKIEIPSEIKEMLKKRTEARKQKDWARADKLRDDIKEKGYEIIDTPQGPKLKKTE